MTEERGVPWLDWDRDHVWHPYTQMATAPSPVPVVRGEGVWLETADGRRILDGISSWWVNVHGHGHPRLDRALAEQAGQLAQVIFAGFTHEPGATLARRLVEITPEPLTRVFYSDDGSTAVEVALKMAYQSWCHRGEPGRTLFVAFDDAYHGDTFGAMAASGVAAFHRTFRDLVFEVRRAATPASRGREGAGVELEQILAEEGERVAAVILEPLVQGAGGMLFQPPAFLAGVRELTREHGVPLIADEIFTGFGRTGTLLACEQAAVAPDLLCLSKALTGGYLPLSVTLATEEIFAAFLSEDRSRTFFHGHSFTGNALACAVALESLAIFEDEGSLARVAELERLFRRRLEGLGALPAVRSTRGMGPLAVVEVEPEGEGAYLDGLGPRLSRAFLERGLLLRPLGNVLYFLPPYVISDREAEWVFDQIEEVLTAESKRLS